MKELLSKFNKLALRNEHMDVTKVFNYFISTLENDDDIRLCSENFMLFIKSAEASRNSSEMIKKIILFQN